MRDLLLCLTITTNLLIYGFIGLNYGAFQQVVNFKTNITSKQQLTTNKQSHNQHDAADLLTTNYPLGTTLPKPQASSLKLQANSKSLTLNSTKQASSSWQGTLSIPSLNIEAPIQYEPETTVSDIQNVLSQGSMSLSPFVPPSKDERMIIFGHSSDYRWKDSPYSNLFALLPQIKIGDTLTMTHQNQIFAYSVKKTQITGPDLHELIEEDPQHNELILSTCYPIGFFSQRYNVVAIPTFVPPETQLSPKSNDQITNPNIQEI